MGSVINFFVVLVFSVSMANAAEVVDKIVAIVNNEFISMSDLEKFKDRVRSNQAIDDLLLLGNTQAQLKKDSKAQLNYLIHEKIMDSEIKRLNLSVTLERVEQEIRDLAKRNGLSRGGLLEAVKGQGFTVSEYQNFVKTRLERQALIEQEITSKIRVSDEDVMAAYIRKNPSQDTAAYEYSVSHIFFNPKKGGAPAAEARAQRVLEKLSAGGSFEELAEQNSEDPGFSTGGALGVFKSGEMTPEFEQAISNLDIGKHSGLVKTKSGIHILKLTSKRVVADPRFEREKEKIRSELFSEAFQKHFRVWLESKKEDSFIKINS